MESFYQSEHFNCSSPDNNQTPRIKQVNLLAGEYLNEFSARGGIIFIMKGELEYAVNATDESYINKRHMLFLPPGYKMRAKAISETEIIFLNIQKKIQFCDCYKIEDLIGEPDIEIKGSTGKEEKKTPPLLQIRRPLWLLLEQLSECLSVKLKCSHYLEAKIKEIFYLFRGFYSKKELATFFAQMNNQDPDFSEYIYTNYNLFETVTELAQSINYSPIDFEKRFFKTFGTSAHQWMMEQKVKNIYQELNAGDKKIKQISEELRFSSPSAFNDFCKKHLNATPGEIRKNKKENQSHKTQGH